MFYECQGAPLEISALLQEKTTSPAGPADLPQLTSQHPLAMAARALTTSVAGPVPVSDERQHIRADNSILAERHQLWDRETHVLVKSRSLIYTDLFATWDADPG